MRKRRFRPDFSHSSAKMFSGGDYVSMIRIGGQPILPPMVLDSDRPQLRKYKEEALKVEAKLAERALKRAEEYESSITLLPDLDESNISNIDTEQVMNFIRQALKDSSHLEEVQHLQKAIFDELQKYDECSSVRKADSMDTLNNIDDFSNAAGSSREVSPSKSFASGFPSPPKQAKDVSPRSSPEGARMVQSCAGDFAEQLQNRPGTPPKLIRRNSYTLESPSPSVLVYLKSLQIDDDDISEVTLSSDKSVKRNLNDLWSEALSTKSADTSSATPVNQSAMSWRSEPDQLSCDHLSLSTQVTAADPLPYVSPNSLNLERPNSNASQKTTNSSKCRENNNVPLATDKAAAKIQAGVRGYLTRRLLKTVRIIELKNAIRDSLITALQMHTETSVSKAELELHRQLTLQIESLCDEWHQIFFEYTPQERMRIIQVDRNKAKNPKPKQPFLRKSKSRVSMESSTSSVSTSSNPVSSVATRPKSLPLMKPAHASAVNYKTWK